jgi:CheY-like chemotaxis protein
MTAALLAPRPVLEASPRASLRVEEARLGPKTVLVADDDHDIRDLVAFRLQSVGYDVVTVDNGHDALATARRQLPDLLVLDVNMPGLDGIEVCYAVHENAVTAEIPVIVVSARAQRTDIDLAYAAGADDFLAKPFQSTILIQRVGWLVGG